MKKYLIYLYVLSWAVLVLGAPSFAGPGDEVPPGFGSGNLHRDAIKEIFSQLSLKDLMNVAHLDKQSESLAYEVYQDHWKPLEVRTKAGALFYQISNHPILGKA